MHNAFFRCIAGLGLSLGLVIVSGNPAWGEEAVTTGFRMTGSGSYESGQLKNWRYKGADFPIVGLIRNSASMTANYQVNEHLRVAAGIAGKLYYDTYEYSLVSFQFDPKRQQFSVSLSSAEAVFNYDFFDMGTFMFEIGYFPFKYNPDSRNLGEYLFRSGTYSPTVFTDIDGSFTKLTGTHLSFNLFDMLTLQGFLTQENQYPSFFDFSLTGMADFNIKKIFTLGAGVMGCRIFPYDEKLTSLKDDQQNTYTDTTLPNNTGYYTLAGTKLMARFSVDPKRIFSEDNWGILAKEDCKIYGEAAVLGLKNYPGYYADRYKRIPRMVGINWPTHEFLSYGLVPGILGYSLEKVDKNRIGKALIAESSGLLFGAASWLARRYLDWNVRPDICAFELEYYGWDYPNSHENVIYFGRAIPAPIGEVGQYTLRDYSNDNWKWSLYVRKVFYEHFSVLVQLANDHLMLPSYNGRYNQSEEVLGKNTSWYWLLKFGFLF